MKHLTTLNPFSLHYLNRDLPWDFSSIFLRSFSSFLFFSFLFFSFFFKYIFLPTLDFYSPLPPPSPFPPPHSFLVFDFFISCDPSLILLLSILNSCVFSLSLPLQPRCKALHKYDASAEDELSLVPGDIIDVDRKEDSGWWLGSIRGGPVKAFPANFCEELPDSAPASPAPPVPVASRPSPVVSAAASPHPSPAMGSRAPPSSPATPASMVAGGGAGRPGPGSIMHQQQQQHHTPPQQHQPPPPPPAAQASPQPAVEKGKMMARCTNPYTAGESNELTLKPGDVVEVFRPT
jgi:hypothetical protein